ncbi:Streptomycin 6-kinase, partial [Candidatus Regiella insecticola 5.15]
KVLDYTDNALLLKRTLGNKSLIKMTRSGLDDQASKIICRVAACLHTPRKQCLPDLMPLSTCFEALMSAAKKHGGIFDDAAYLARSLLAKPEEVVVLHGDLHHGNILDSGSQGWLAIDPKGFLGERGFDFANIFCNPDADIATSPGRLMKQVMVVTKMAHLEQHRLLAWIVSWAALSAAWHIEDGGGSRHYIGSCQNCA